MPAILFCLPPPQGNQSVYSVNWAFGAVVRTEINTTTGHLSVDLISDKIKAIKPCRNLKLGPLVSSSCLASTFFELACFSATVAEGAALVFVSCVWSKN